MDASTGTIQQAESVNQLLADATAALAAAGVQTPRLDAEVLLAAACGLDRGAFFVRSREPVQPRCRDEFRSMLTRRATREPLQYIVGRQEFWSLDFVVTPHVLIPRSETEQLVELAVDTGKRCAARHPTLCDLGTGSGCIAVALARELPAAEVWALDSSRPALEVAATNARRHAVADRIRFVESDLFDSVGGQRFDAIVSNPPYVSSSDLGSAQPELRWEPRQALDGGVTGLDVIRRVVAAAPDFLVEGGWLIMEIGADQAVAVQALAAAARFSAVSVRPDYAGLPRVLLGRR